ncbi:MAG: ABC transporter substrate-binding protein [Nocardioides sp.]|nr:ABC transporter substrate-binding protein [Nocardioides sp.]
MGRTRKRIVALASAAVVAVGIAGCGSGDTSSSDSEPGTTSERSEAVKGGDITYLEDSVIQSLDPQRTYTGRDISNYGRLFSRSWLVFPAGATDATEGTTPIPDMATDLGTKNEDASQWQFTLKEGPTWQDGSPVTCEDFKYGVSRTFATDVITGGPNYIIGYLDIEKDAEGDPAYKGPYTGEGQELFDQAVTCEGNTITYNFSKPWPDFPLAIASLRAFDPYREAEDQGDQSNFTVFSSGPYMLEGEWNEDTGGTFVRNPEWDGGEDTTREANFDSLTFQIGDAPEVIIDRLIADSGEDTNAISVQNITAAQYPQITGDVESRSINIESPFTNYLVPNFNTQTDPLVRQALALATNRAAYVGALGGELASTPALSIVNPDVPGYQANDAFGSPEGGDVEGAAALLEQAGVELPYPIKLTYPIGSDAGNSAFAALKATYDEAGFEVELDGLDPSGPYYDTIQQPGSDSDLIWGGWGADWPSVSTVIPPLFDSRLNLTKASNGQDYGNYDSKEANALMDQAGAEADLDAANEIYTELDALLATDVAYIPLDTTKFYYLRGSNIENYVNSVSTSGYPDLGVISVAGGGE